MFAFLIPTFAFAPRAEDVQLKFNDIPPLVTERNQHVRGAGLKRQSAEAARGKLGRSFLPKVAVRGGHENYQTGSQNHRSEPFGAIEARMNLFRGGRDSLAGEIINAKAKTAGLESEQEIRNEIKKARQNYWQLVSLREQIQLLEDAKAENARNQKSAQSRIRAGLATETDKIEFELHQLSLDQDLARIQLAEANTERQLAILTGLGENVRIVTERVVSHDHSDQLLSTPYQIHEHPVVASLTLRAEEAALEKRQYNRWWMPQLDIYGSYGLHTFREREYPTQSERYESVAGVQLSLELFDGWHHRNEATQKVMWAEGLRHEAQQSARELKADIDAAKAELKLTHDLIHQSEAALKRAGMYLVRTLEEYRKGVKNSPDVLSAAERDLQIKRRFAELRRDYQLARAELLSVLGK